LHTGFIGKKQRWGGDIGSILPVKIKTYPSGTEHKFASKNH
jgi:hypothetical protein